MARGPRPRLGVRHRIFTLRVRYSSPDTREYRCQAVACGCAADPVARVPARGHGLEHLHPAHRPCVGPAGPRRVRDLPAAAGRAVRPGAARAGRPARRRPAPAGVRASTATRASRPGTWPTSRAAELDRYTAANVAAIARRARTRPGRPRAGEPRADGRARGRGRVRRRDALRGQGARLRARVRDPRPAPAGRDGPRSRSPAPPPSSPGRATSSRSPRSSWARAATGRRCGSCRPGVDTDEFAPGRGSLEALARLLGARSPGRPGEPAERAADAGAAAGLEGLGRFVLYFGKLMRQKGVHLLLDAWREVAPRHPGRAARRRRLRRRPGRARGAGAAGRRLHGRDGSRPAAAAGAPGGRGGRAVGAARGVRDGRGRGGRVRGRPDRVRPLGPGRGRGRVWARPGSRSTAAPPTWRVRLDALLGLPAAERRRLGALAREAVVARWSWERIARRLLTEAQGSTRTRR